MVKAEARVITPSTNTWDKEGGTPVEELHDKSLLWHHIYQELPH